MGKMRLYAGILILAILLYGCKGQENGSIQDNINIETETEDTVESMQDNAGAEEDTETMQQPEADKTKWNEPLWNVESASVSDSDFTITLGTLYEDFDYNEEEAPTEYEDGWPRNYIGFVTIYGVDRRGRNA